jgi:phosphatidylserine decarboxylase
MKPIYYINRLTGLMEQEKVFGASAVNFVYGDGLLSRSVGTPLGFIVRTSLFSALMGWWQRLPMTEKNIAPFIKEYGIDIAEFAEDPSTFHSFNDFFIRHLKPSARPMAPGDDVAVIPADGRYYFYQRVDQCEGFVVKGEKFCLGALLRNDQLAQQYAKGSMVIARLCPSDYHRFHFPCAGIPSESRLINGWLYSVNPLAIAKDLSIFTKNKRTLCEIETSAFGNVLYMDVGATCVGSIHQTYQAGNACAKGDEKGYFSFGGSSLVLLFPPNAICFDDDLLNATERGMEIRCLVGQRMGRP